MVKPKFTGISGFRDGEFVDFLSTRVWVKILLVTVLAIFLLKLVYFQENVSYSRVPVPIYHKFTNKGFKTENKLEISGVQIAFVVFDHSSNHRQIIDRAKPGSDLRIAEGTILKEARNVSSSSLRLECYAKFPITWVYSGYGNPSIESVQNSRSIKNLQDESSYNYSSILDFGQSYLQQGDTGKYSCQTMIGKHKRGLSHFYIFVPGPKGILQSGGNERLQVVHDQFLDGPIITIPCTVSNPSSIPQLYHNETTQVELGKSVFFHPKSGFRITITDFESPWGNYTCKLRVKGGSQSVAEFELKTTPYPTNWWFQAGEVRISPNAFSVEAEVSTPKLFECEGKEEVDILLRNPDNINTIETNTNPARLRRPDLIVSYNTAEEGDLVSLKHKATVIAMPWHLDSKNQSATINCIRKRDNFIFHSWTYAIAQRRNTAADRKFSLEYSNLNNEFTCCSPRTSKAPGTLNVIQCSSLPECQVKGEGWGPNQNGNLVTLVNNGCTKWTPTNSYSYGMVQCRSQGKQDFIIFYSEEIESSLNGSRSKIIHLLDSESIRNAELSLKVIKNPATLNNTLSNTSQSNNNNFTVECSGNSFYFARGFVWVWSNETIIPPESFQISEEFIPPYYTSKIRLGIDENDANKTGISCLGPVWNSEMWKRATV